MATLRVRKRPPPRGSVTLSDAGAGLLLHVPQLSHFEFRLEGAAPISTQNAPQGKSFQLYGRFSFSY